VFNAPIENSLRESQFGVKIGEPLIGFWSPTKRFFRLRFQTSVPSIVKNS